MARPRDFYGSRPSRPDWPGWKARRVACRRDTATPPAAPLLREPAQQFTGPFPSRPSRRRRGRAAHVAAGPDCQIPFTRTHAARGPTRPAARRSGTCAGPFSRLAPAAQTAHGLQTCALHYRLRLTPSRPPPPILPPPPAPPREHLMSWRGAKRRDNLSLRAKRGNLSGSCHSCESRNPRLFHHRGHRELTTASQPRNTPKTRKRKWIISRRDAGPQSLETTKNTKKYEGSFDPDRRRFTHG